MNRYVTATRLFRTLPVSTPINTMGSTDNAEMYTDRTLELPTEKSRHRKRYQSTISAFTPTTKQIYRRCSSAYRQHAGVTNSKTPLKHYQCLTPMTITDCITGTKIKFCTPPACRRLESLCPPTLYHLSVSPPNYACTCKPHVQLEVPSYRKHINLGLTATML